MPLLVRRDEEEKGEGSGDTSVLNIRSKEEKEEEKEKSRDSKKIVDPKMVLPLVRREEEEGQRL